LNRDRKKKLLRDVIVVVIITALVAIAKLSGYWVLAIVIAIAGSVGVATYVIVTNRKIRREH